MSEKSGRYSEEELEKMASRTVSDGDKIQRGAKYIQDLGAQDPRLEESRAGLIRAEQARRAEYVYITDPKTHEKMEPTPQQQVEIDREQKKRWEVIEKTMVRHPLGRKLVDCKTEDEKEQILKNMSLQEFQSFLQLVKTDQVYLTSCVDSRGDEDVRLWSEAPAGDGWYDGNCGLAGTNFGYKDSAGKNSDYNDDESWKNNGRGYVGQNIVSNAISSSRYGGSAEFNVVAEVDDRNHGNPQRLWLLARKESIKP